MDEDTSTNNDLSVDDHMKNIDKHVQDILQITGQDEVMQSFVRVDTTDFSEETWEKEKKVTTFKLRESSEGSDQRKQSKDETKSIDQQASSSSMYVTSEKELKTKKGRKKSRRQKLLEEVYTDKDRAAAVNLGSRDIKQSLKLKRRQDRSRILEISEEAHPGTLLALGNYELRNKDVKIAINFVNKALELNPYDKNALVARSKCHLLLGEAKLALDDANKSLLQDKKFVKGIYQKAEALYHLGKFEYSLMYFHRGLHQRPEMEDFRLGVQKAEQAIKNTIGKTMSKFELLKLSNTLGLNERGANMEEAVNREIAESSKRKSDIKYRSKCLLKELHVDKEYLENLLHNPDIQCANSDNNKITMVVNEGVQFLNNRQEFWRQQRPVKPKRKPKCQI